MEKRGLVGAIVVLGILFVTGFFWFVGEYSSEEEVKCVPVSCCHATECVFESEAPNCNGTSCSMGCEPNTLDCGQGRCQYIDYECGVVWNE